MSEPEMVPPPVMAAPEATPSDTTPSDTTPSDTTPSDTTPSDTTPSDEPAPATPASPQAGLRAGFYVLLGLTGLSAAVSAISYSHFRSSWGWLGRSFEVWAHPDGGGGVVYLVFTGLLALATVVVGVVMAVGRARLRSAAARTGEYMRTTAVPALERWRDEAAHATGQGASALGGAWTRLVAKHGPGRITAAVVGAVVLVAGLAIGVPAAIRAVVVTPQEAFAARYDDAVATVTEKVDSANVASAAEGKELVAAGERTLSAFTTAMGGGDLDGLKAVAAPRLAARLAAFEAIGAASAWRGTGATYTAPGLSAVPGGPLAVPAVVATVGQMEVAPDDVARGVVTLTSQDIEVLHLTVDGVPVDDWVPPASGVAPVPILAANSEQVAMLVHTGDGWVVDADDEDAGGGTGAGLFISLSASLDSRGAGDVTVGTAALRDLYQTWDGDGAEILAGTYDVTLPGGRVDEGVDLTTWTADFGISDSAVSSVISDLRRLVDRTVVINNGGSAWGNDDGTITIGDQTFPRVWSNNTSTNHKVIDFSPTVAKTEYANGYRTVTVTFTGESGPVLEYMVDSTVNGPNTRYVIDTVTATAVLDNDGDVVELTGVTWADPVKQ